LILLPEFKLLYLTSKYSQFSLFDETSQIFLGETILNLDFIPSCHNSSSGEMKDNFTSS